MEHRNSSLQAAVASLRPDNAALCLRFLSHGGERMKSAVSSPPRMAPVPEGDELARPSGRSRKTVCPL